MSCLFAFVRVVAPHGLLVEVRAGPAEGHGAAVACEAEGEGVAVDEPRGGEVVDQRLAVQSHAHNAVGKLRHEQTPELGR